MQYAVDNWLSAEKQSLDADTSPTSQSAVADTAADSQPSDAAGELFAMDEDDESTESAVPQVIPRARSATPRMETLSSIPTVSIDTPESVGADFCFITEQDVGESPMLARRKLRDGFHWQKQLVFRSKLTMHTAFERKDNKEPAAVTALAVSR